MVEKQSEAIDSGQTKGDMIGSEEDRIKKGKEKLKKGRVAAELYC